MTEKDYEIQKLRGENMILRQTVRELNQYLAKIGIYDSSPLYDECGGAE